MRKTLIIAILMLCGCSASELIYQPLPRTKVDTTYIPRQIDTLKLSDKLIGFDVGVDEWEDNNEYNF